MGTYYSADGFATNDVVGAIAAAALHDLHANNFVFTGFPSVLVTEVGKQFEIRLSIGQATSGPLVVPFKVGQAKKQIDRDWMKKVQGLIVELERGADMGEAAITRR
jgi:hypothetical protein